MKEKSWVIIFGAICISLLLFIGGLNVVIDPFLHFHAPLSGLEYPLKDERYVNDGLQRQMEYQILVTGTSMSQNFYASTVEGLWQKKCIKTAYSGASLHELSEYIERAIDRNPQLELVICSLDLNKIGEDAEAVGYEDLPVYLYDENPWNDVNYIFNKEVALKSIAVLNYTRAGEKTPSFDMYGRFDQYQPHGREAVLISYSRPEIQDYGLVFDEEAQAAIRCNLEQNIIRLAKKYPEVSFCYYIPPYSYCYWDGMVRTSQLDYSIDAISYASGLLLTQENIELYCFYERTDITTELENYTDTIHYVGSVCDIITESIFEKRHMLKEDTYQSYFDTVKTLYKEMEYDF